MTQNLPPRSGLSAPIVTSIPEKWDREWFRTFITYFLGKIIQTQSTGVSGVSVTTSGGQQQIGLASQPGDSVLGVSGSAAAPPAAIVATADGQVLQRAAGVLVFAPPSGGSSSPLTTKGDLFGFGSANARIPVGSNDQSLYADSTQTLGVRWGPNVPGTIPDLTFWWESDDTLGTNGQPVQYMGNRAPALRGAPFGRPGAGGFSANTEDTATLNGLPLLLWGGTYLNFSDAGFYLKGGATFFMVIKPTAVVGSQSVIGGAANSLALYLCNTTQACLLVETGAAVIGTSTTTWVAGTAFQMNATYNSTSGAYAFRQGQAAAGSGVGGAGAGVGLTTFIGADAAVNPLGSPSLAAIIIYNRILSGSEITTVESYLHTKWGV